LHLQLAFVLMMYFSQTETARQVQHIISRFVEALHTDQLHKEIHQATILQKRLEDEKRFAEEANKIKTRFMATVSHEGMKKVVVFRI
jgi:hypothetical protein